MDDLKELLGKVTPGPWAYRPTQYDDWGTVRAGEWFICQAKDPRHLEDDRLNWCRKNGCDPWEANARLIAMAPDLAAEVLRLRAEVERLTEALQNALAAGLPDVVAEAARAALPGNSAGTGCKLSCECPDCNEM